MWGWASSCIAPPLLVQSLHSPAEATVPGPFSLARRPSNSGCPPALPRCTHLQCGGCWAFAVVAAIESLFLISHNQTWDFSEQQLIDCATEVDKYSSRGCAGGWATDGLEYVRRANLTTEELYPFR